MALLAQGIRTATSIGVREQIYRDTHQHNASRTIAITPAHAASTSWTIVFRQTVPNYFSSNEWSKNSQDPSNANYAILDQLESYRGSDGKFTFKLGWPGSTLQDQIWKQTLNPVGAGQSSTRPVDGYEAVSVPYPAACGKPRHRASVAAQHKGGLV